MRGGNRYKYKHYKLKESAVSEPGDLLRQVSEPKIRPM